MPQVICTIRRKNGTRVEFSDGTEYHFKPAKDNPDGPHVAEVTSQAHLARFAGIPESYEIEGESPEKTAALQAALIASRQTEAERVAAEKARVEEQKALEAKHATQKKK